VLLQEDPNFKLWFKLLERWHGQNLATLPKHLVDSELSREEWMGWIGSMVVSEMTFRHCMLLW
jgi:hypothetical protein